MTGCVVVANLAATMSRRTRSTVAAALLALFGLLLELITRNGKGWPREHNSLTPREREVLLWLTQGKSNAEIGLILGITTATVGKHLERIYPKLEVENRTAAASFAVARKLLLGSAVIRFVEPPGFNSADVLRLDGFYLTKQAL